MAAVAARGAAAADLIGPDDAGRRRRLEWATLLRRSWGIDALACPRCGEQMALVAVIDDERVASRILEHLGLSTRAPPRGPPWRPQLALGGVRNRPLVDSPDAADAPSHFD